MSLKSALQSEWNVVNGKSVRSARTVYTSMFTGSSTLIAIQEGAGVLKTIALGLAGGIAGAIGMGIGIAVGYAVGAATGFGMGVSPKIAGRVGAVVMGLAGGIFGMSAGHVLLAGEILPPGWMDKGTSMNIRVQPDFNNKAIKSEKTLQLTAQNFAQYKQSRLAA